ncbi:hypothetical protein TL16_g07683 [Triparma laevis f. inornata]|uniref:Uncharacterized protein n=1 Tax=Triparma laevis f. inornata TaxID=1714386 RepID=A0A9W7EED2_9STRA|nr:hypothetical protein TL16_g07683 [Triparma laevis f. inornata]
MYKTMSTPPSVPPSSPPTSLDSRYKLGRSQISTSHIPTIEKGITLLGKLLQASIEKTGERSVRVDCFRCFRGALILLTLTFYGVG